MAARCIETGDEALIGISLEASKRITTPHVGLDQRFREWEWKPYRLGLKPGIPPFRIHGLHELEKLARESLALARDRAEAAGRFANVNTDTDQEHWCCVVLAGLASDDFGLYDGDEVAERFKARPNRLPHTLADCLHELDYWRDLCRLRQASREAPGAYAHEGPGEASARRFFVEDMLAEIRPRNRDEAKAVLRHANIRDLLNGAKGDAILANLIG